MIWALSRIYGKTDSKFKLSWRSKLRNNFMNIEPADNDVKYKPTMISDKP